MNVTIWHFPVLLRSISKLLTKMHAEQLQTEDGQAACVENASTMLPPLPFNLRGFSGSPPGSASSRQRIAQGRTRGAFPNGMLLSNCCSTI
jgi:hypothetical protein